MLTDEFILSYFLGLTDEEIKDLEVEGQKEGGKKVEKRARELPRPKENLVGLRRILKALKEVADKNTTLVIAHRLSTIIDANTILVMEQGRIVEQGDHQALLEQGGLYAQMWELQQREAAEHVMQQAEEAGPA